MEAIKKKIDDFFGQNVHNLCTKLEFQERNTPQHHSLIWLEDGVREHMDEIDEMICAELPRPGEDDRLMNW